MGCVGGIIAIPRLPVWWTAARPAGSRRAVILDARGKGHYVGCVLNIDNFDASNQEYTWPGEGDDMIFIDGEPWPPSLHGTGTEDYFGMSWGFPAGQHSTPYHGVSLGSDVQEHFGKWSLYRFHIEDPVHFSESIRVTIEHGHANDQGNDYSSVAYWYQLDAAAAKPLPAVASALSGAGPNTVFGTAEPRATRGVRPSATGGVKVTPKYRGTVCRQALS